MTTPTDPQRMERIVSLCKRRGFIFQSGEIYGGLNGAWDMGPLGVELHPKIKWGGDRTPSDEELDKMHHAAHENCFIANSVTTEVTVAK